MKLKLDPFVLSIIGAVVVAFLIPQWGAKDSPIPLDSITSVGISLIFFFYGLKLSPEKLKNGIRNWKLHILVQSSTFLLFPLVVIAFYPFISTDQGREIWLAFLFLAALPSTVSASVVMVSIAKGNVPAAIFNASISGLIGIAVTPLWMGLFMESAGSEFDLGEIYIKLITEILLPVILGLFLQRFFEKFVHRYGHYLAMIDKFTILLIIYKSFARSFADGVFQSVNPLSLLLISIALLVLFFGVYYLVGFTARQLGFNTEDQITAQFCGTKKSLVHGSVFAAILFAGSTSLGLMLLPLMIFHSMQILIISVFASNKGRR